MGSERIYLPVIEPKHSEYVMIQIKNKDFFNACDFKLSEIKSIKYTNEEKKITQVKPAKTE